MAQWWRRLVLGELARLRREGRSSLLWSLRITVAATASYVAGTLVFPGTQPLLAPLTAMLVVQVTPVSLLASGIDRVVAVVAGVSLAVGFAAVVPLHWWSLGVLILVAISIGQVLRLRANLIEVAISAMLVLGVGVLGASAAAGQRISETLVGAGVGILANLVFPPKVASSDAGHAIDGLADSVSGLLGRAADSLDELAGGEGRDRLRTASREWLGEARLITHEIPNVGAALLRAEEGRRFNVRAVRTPHVEAGLRQGLEALEHTAIAVRSLMRAVADASDGAWLDEPDGDVVLDELAQTFRQMAAGIDAFGDLVRNEADAQVELGGDDIARLRSGLEGLHQARARLDAAIAAGPGPDVLELHNLERSAVRRLLGELDLEARVRRQLGLFRPRRRPRSTHRPERPELWPPSGPDDETRAMPRASEDDEP
ncbi:MAG: FUSC family protein [Marmoricola sp.]